VYLLIRLAAVLLQAFLLNLGLLLFSQLMERLHSTANSAREPLVLQLLLDPLELVLTSRHVLVPPRPLHLALALGARLVEVARRAVTLVHDGVRLQAIGEDNIRVHGSHVQMIQDRRLQPVRAVPEPRQLLYDLVTHFVQIHHHRQVALLLDLDGPLHRALDVVDEELDRLRGELELAGYVGAEYAGLEGFDGGAHVGL